MARLLPGFFHMKQQFLFILFIFSFFACFAQSKNEIIHELIQLQTELKDHPDDINIIFNIGNNYFLLGQYNKAIEWYEKVLLRFPQCFAPLKYCGHAKRFQGNPAEAITYYQKALETKPTEPHAQYGLAESLLALGNFKDGWRYWESRYKRGKDIRNFNEKKWTAGISFVNKRVLLRAEYGLGDTIQFTRYAQLLKKQNAYVIVEAQRPLVDLLQCCPFIDEVVPLSRFKNLPEFDIQIPIMSLPYVFFEQHSDVLDNTPYIFPKPELVSYWADQLKRVHNDTKFKIGICWDCAPQFDKLRPQLSKKVIALKEFIPLLQLPNVSVYSLQKMHGTKQIKQLPPNAILHTFNDDFDKKNGRFMDSAAVIANLDLVITVDTSVAHLAGAMGKPVWVLLPYVADWRWMTSRTDTPWYKSMKLFRQQEAGNWKQVLDSVIAEL